MQIQTLIRFESKRCPSGYDLVAVNEDVFALDYRRLKPPFVIAETWMSELRPRGPETDRASPFDHDAGLFMRFAKLPYDPFAYQTFTNNFGRLVPPLFSDEIRNRASIPALGTGGLRTLSVAAFHSIIRSALGMPIDSQPAWVGEFRKAYSLVANTSKRWEDPLKELADDFAVLKGNWFLPDPTQHLRALIEAGTKATIEADTVNGRPTLVLRPENLMVAIALQTVKHLSGGDEAVGIKLFQCKQCGNYFNVGPGTGRRSRSLYCSRRCQNQHSYQVKKSQKGATS